MTNILIVDDSAADRILASRLLKQTPSWNVLFAEHGRAALEQLQQHTIDLVVTDLQMPELDGLGLVERIREEYPAVPVILMTARGSEVTAVKALQAGAASYVPKKALAQDLVETVHRILETSREHASYRRLLNRMHEASFVLENDLDLISSLVSYLTHTIRDLGRFDQVDCHRLSTALDEAITNAYYHGNLEVQSTVREAGSKAYRTLAQARISEPRYRDRRIHVKAHFSGDEVRFVVRDDGDGFDSTIVADPTSPELVERPSGRGLSGALGVFRIIEIQYRASHDLPLRIADTGHECPVAVEHAATLRIDDGEHVGGEIVAALERGAGNPRAARPTLAPRSSLLCHRPLWPDIRLRERRRRRAQPGATGDRPRPRRVRCPATAVVALSLALSAMRQ
ncbi:MAG: response regulator [Acidobacteria bacterium]|nr:response regulator [Acidobacteriota bacterium]